MCFESWPALKSLWLERTEDVFQRLASDVMINYICENKEDGDAIPVWREGNWEEKFIHGWNKCTLHAHTHRATEGTYASKYKYLGPVSI